MRVGIALGANLGDRLAQLQEARAAVLALTGVVEPVLFSNVYETLPVDCPPGTPPYYNSVMELGYGADVQDLAMELQRIEQKMGRPEKRLRNASRTIDLDLLYADEMVLSDENLILPHPRMHQRRFVLEPLAELVPQKILPRQSKTVAELLSALPQNGDVVRLEDWL